MHWPGIGLAMRTYDASGLPARLAIDPVNGVITGVIAYSSAERVPDGSAARRSVQSDRDSAVAAIQASALLVGRPCVCTRRLISAQRSQRNSCECSTANRRKCRANWSRRAWPQWGDRAQKCNSASVMNEMISPRPAICCRYRRMRVSFLKSNETMSVSTTAASIDYVLARLRAFVEASG